MCQHTAQSPFAVLWVQELLPQCLSLFIERLEFQLNKNLSLMEMGTASGPHSFKPYWKS